MHWKCLLCVLHKLLTQLCCIFNVGIGVEQEKIFLSAEDIAGVLCHNGCQVTAHLEILLTLLISSIKEAHIREALQHIEVAQCLVLSGLLQDLQCLLKVVFRLPIAFVMHQFHCLLEFIESLNVPLLGLTDS